MGERTGQAWADKHLGVTYDWLCRCLNPPKAGTLLLTDGTKIVSPSEANAGRNNTQENPRLPKLKQTLPTVPSASNADWTDNEFIKTCVRFIESTLRPLESDPQRFHRVALAIAQEIVGETEKPNGGKVDGEGAQTATPHPALSTTENRPVQNSFSSSSVT